jgi:rRNA maturation RNase YbeY
MKDINIIFYNNSNDNYIDNLIIEKNNQTVFSDYINSLNLNYKSIYLEYSFISSDDMKKLNTNFLNHNYDTDILSFNLSIEDSQLFGNFYLSYNQILKNAIEFDTMVSEELNRVIIHGFLHLIGFNDQTTQEKLLIRNEENKFLEYYKTNVPRGTK